MEVCVAENSGGRCMGAGPSIGWIGVSAVSEVSEERATSNGEDHVGPPYCKRILTVEGINGDSVGPRDHVFFFQKPLCRNGNDRS